MGEVGAHGSVVVPVLRVKCTLHLPVGSCPFLCGGRQQRMAKRQSHDPELI